MNQLVWGKTFLEIYKYLEALTNAMDNLIKKQVDSSNIYYYGKDNSSFYHSNRIIELMQRKTNLINIKILIEKALNKLKLNEKKLLYLTYYDNITYKNLLLIFNCSLRTYYRRKKIAICNFSLALESLGYNFLKLMQLFKNETWLINLYNKNLIETKNSYDSEKDGANSMFKLLLKNIKVNRVASEL